MFMKFLIPDYPLYTYQEQGRNKGMGYEASALDLQVAFSAEFVPYFGRVVLELQKAKPMAFLATEPVERNKDAAQSGSVMTIEWTWVWLKEQNYHVTASTTDIRGLVNLLVFKRVDVILLPHLTIDTLMEQQRTKAS